MWIKEGEPMSKKFALMLRAKERETLRELAKKGKEAGWKLRQAQAVDRGEVAAHSGPT